MQIELTVPVPPARKGREVGSGKYPFHSLPIGGSFVVPLSEATRAGWAVRVWKFRHPGWDYRTRRLEGEFRVWRIG